MLDLTTREGIDRFADLFGTRRGRWLANRLNLAGKGSETLANWLSALAWNGRAAYTVDSMNKWKAEANAKNTYADCCAMIAEDVLKHPLYESVARSIKVGKLRFEPF